MRQTSSLQSIYADVQVNVHRVETLDQKVEELEGKVRELEISQASEAGRNRIIAGLAGAICMALLNLAVSFISLEDFSPPARKPNASHPVTSQTVKDSQE